MKKIGKVPALLCALRLLLSLIAGRQSPAEAPPAESGARQMGKAKKSR